MSKSIWLAGWLLTNYLICASYHAANDVPNVAYFLIRPSNALLSAVALSLDVALLPRITEAQFATAEAIGPVGQHVQKALAADARIETSAKMNGHFLFSRIKEVALRRSRTYTEVNTNTRQGHPEATSYMLCNTGLCFDLWVGSVVSHRRLLLLLVGCSRAPSP